MDIALADSAFVQVVAVNFDPHYLNEEYPFMESSFLSEVFTFRTWSTIFSKEKEEVHKVCYKLLFQR